MMNHRNDSAAMKTAVLLQPAGSRRSPANRPFAEMDRQLRDSLVGTSILWALPQATFAAFRDGSGIAAERVLCLPDVASQLSDFDRVLLQPLSIFPRAQEPLIDLPDGVRSHQGTALVRSRSSAIRFIDALRHQRAEGQPVVLVAHGRTGTHPSEAISLFVEVLAEHWPEAALLTVDGPPGFAPLARLIDRIRQQERVRLVPLMFTHGYHVQHDLLGEDVQSLRSQLPDVRIACEEPLGQQTAVIGLWRQQIADTLASIPEPQ